MNLDADSRKSKTDKPSMHKKRYSFPDCSEQGFCYQMDSTTLPVFLISSLGNNPFPMGQAVLYCVADVYSQMIVGFHLGLEKKSYNARLLAFLNSIENKVTFCERYGFKNVKWDCNSLPSYIVVDIQPEFAGLANITSNLGIEVHRAPLHSPAFKGIFERITQNLAHLPVSVSRDGGRGELGERSYAKITFDELTKIVIANILNHNASVINGYVSEESVEADDEPLTPNGLWEHGIAKVGDSGRVLPNDYAFINLLPKGKASINKRGVLFDGRFYNCNASENDWYVKHTGEKLNIAYDPRNVNDIYILEEHGTRYITCSLPKDSPFLNMTLDECKPYGLKGR